MRTGLIASVFGAAFASSGVADAQTYPTHPITMVVPLPAGSAFDVTARIVAERMQASLGQLVIIDNVTGASGSIGAGRVARAAPDGYTLCFGGVGTHVLNGAILSLPYDVLRDFAPVRAGCDRPARDSREEGYGGEQPCGAGRLAEGES
jgi:tripartite-type tricarboxylate transporter receptor subunit TctC